jgi:protein-disulfide isomerase/uncharacterized membrane protein
MKATVLTATLFVLATFAAFISHHLTIKHVAGSSGQSWFEAGCSDSQERGAANCAAVLASPYAYFPPKHDPASPRLHVPVAFLGLVYYTTIALWAIGIGIPSRSRIWLHALLTGLVALGILSSAYFVYLMFARMDQWCPWCAVTHGANLLIGVCVLLMWPMSLRRDAAALVPAAESGVPTSAKRGSQAAAVAVPRSLPRPTNRAIVLTLIAILGINNGHWSMMAMKIYKKAAENMQSFFGSCKTALVGSLLTNWHQQPELDIPIRSDEPIREFKQGGGNTVDVVVFSDFECPSCQRFAGYFEKQYIPLLKQPVRLAFKHYPLDQACNQFASKTLHAHACQAARWAEAARLVGGNEAFWRAHDYLFQHRDELAAGRMITAQVAQALGLDAAALEQQAQSAEVTNRIAEDIAAARRFNVIGTPAVFIEGKPIDQIAKGEASFWQGLAEGLSRQNQPVSPAP